jgi:hypothetical protein
MKHSILHTRELPEVSGETLRVNGRAEISIAPTLLERFTVDGKAPRSVIVVCVESVYFQCSRAILRSELWDSTRHANRGSLPSVGTILAALSESKIDGTTYDRELPERLKSTLY